MLLLSKALVYIVQKTFDSRATLMYGHQIVKGSELCHMI